MKAIYDIERSYAENAADGPFFDGEIPQRVWPPESEWVDFLGTKVASRLGVPAGPLLNSRWIGLAADLGYDVLTYKTIRSHRAAGHPLPNIVFVEDQGNFVAQRIDDPTEELGITNSFGMPSMDRDYLLEDIPRAYSLLHKGQALIISIVGTPGRGDFLADFLETARLAVEAGATHIEANFSCPNVTSGEGELYTSPAEFGRFASAIAKEIAPIPLLIKMGALLDEELLRDTLLIAARAGVQGICGINTIRMQVVDRDGEPALGSDRPYGGVCGGVVRKTGLEFTRLARKIIDEERLDLTLVGLGGIIRPEEVDLYLEAGADFTQTATGMMWDPYLADKYHRRKG